MPSHARSRLAPTPIRDVIDRPMAVSKARLGYSIALFLMACPSSGAREHANAPDAADAASQDAGAPAPDRDGTAGANADNNHDAGAGKGLGIDAGAHDAGTGARDAGNAA